MTVLAAAEKEDDAGDDEAALPDVQPLKCP